MATSQEQQRLFGLALSARRLTSAVEALTLTNNPDATLRAAEATAEGDTLSRLAATGAGDKAVVQNAQQLTVPVTGTYVSKATVTVVNGVVTAIALS